MSGPIPAGSPSVTASGCAPIGSSTNFDHGAAAKLLEEAFGLGIILLGDHLIANLAPGRRIVAARRGLAAHGECLDPGQGDLRRRELPKRRAVKHLTLRRGEIGG